MAAPEERGSRLWEPPGNRVLSGPEKLKAGMNRSDKLRGWWEKQGAGKWVMGPQGFVWEVGEMLGRSQARRALLPGKDGQEEVVKSQLWSFVMLECGPIPTGLLLFSCSSSCIYFCKCKSLGLPCSFAQLMSFNSNSESLSPFLWLLPRLIIKIGPDQFFLLFKCYKL